MRVPARPPGRAPNPWPTWPGPARPRARSPPGRAHAFPSSQAGIPLLAGSQLPRPDQQPGSGAPSASVERDDLRRYTSGTTDSVVRSVRYNEFSKAGDPTDNVPVASVTSVTEVTHHVLDPGVVLESVHRQILTVPGVLEAAVRHLGHERDVGVDPDGAEVQPPGQPHGPAVVPGPDARGQAVLHAVRPAHRLLLGAEPLHRDDRAEDLLLDHLVVLPQAGDDGRGE